MEQAMSVIDNCLLQTLASIDIGLSPGMLGAERRLDLHRVSDGPVPGAQGQAHTARLPARY